MIAHRFIGGVTNPPTLVPSPGGATHCGSSWSVSWHLLTMKANRIRWNIFGGEVIVHIQQITFGFGNPLPRNVKSV